MAILWRSIGEKLSKSKPIGKTYLIKTEIIRDKTKIFETVAIT